MIDQIIGHKWYTASIYSTIVTYYYGWDG